jgi:diguanylate cyclase (GGDEF)-like protein
MVLMRGLINTLLCTFFLLSFSQLGHASYSKNYDEELNKLTVTNPEQALKTIKKQIQKAEQDGDYNRQLILYFYMAESYSVLSNIDEIQKIIDKAQKIAKAHNSTRFISEFMGFESFVLGLKGDLRESSRKANMALQFAKETNDYRLIASMLSIRAEAHLAIENYSLALKDIQAAISIFKEYGDRENLNYNYNIMALIYDSLEEYDKAIKYYDVSSSYDDSGSLYNQAVLYYNKGTTYSYKGDKNLAIDNLNKALVLSQEIGDDATAAFVEYSLAELYMQENKNEKIQPLAVKALDWFKDSGDVLMQLNAGVLLTNINIDKGDFKQAEYYLNNVEELSKIINTPRTLLSVLWVKTRYFAKQEMWKSAYETSQKSLKTRGDLYDKEKESSIEEMKLKYDTQFDQEKMDYLRKQNQLQHAIIEEEQHKKQYFYGLMALAILSIMGIYYAYRNQRNIKRKLYQITIKDDLTQIGNRRYILELLSQIHEKSITGEQSYTIVMIDLDHFKTINDRYGHFKGNEVLIHFANVVKYILPESCDVGRLGGEEWLLLLPNFDKEKTQLLLSNIRRKYNNPELLKLPISCALLFSSGVRICDGECLDIEHSLQRADKALYQAKDNGRNQDVYC